MSYLTRITCNTNGWIMPSGLICKCPKLYESIAGFGWDEWLFNSRNQYNGYQYGFLECFNKRQLNIEREYEDVYLYVRCCNQKPACSKIRIKINRLIKLSFEEAQFIQNHFTQNGNIALMQGECPNQEAFNQGPTHFIFNVKFKIEDVSFTKSKCFTPPVFRYIMMQIDNPQNLNSPKYIETNNAIQESQFTPFINFKKINDDECIKG